MENKIRLVVTSKHLSPSEIISSIGVKADKHWALGDKRESSNVLEKENGLIIESGLESSLMLEQHIQGLMTLTSGQEHNFLKFSESLGCEVQLACAIYCRGAPPLSFEEAAIRWLGSIGASLDVDIYLL